MTTHELVQKMASAAWERGHIPYANATELSRNVLTVLLTDREFGLDNDPEAIILEAVQHRIAHGWLQCSCPKLLAHRMAEVWSEYIGGQHV